MQISPHSVESVISRVRASLDRFGYYFLGSDEMEDVVGHFTEGDAKLIAPIRDMAHACGAEVEFAPNFRAARFVRPVEAVMAVG